MKSSAPLRRLSAPSASSFRFFVPFQTRWNDNDIYGHLNNARYLELIDSTINNFLINHGGLVPHPALATKGKKAGLGPVALVVNSTLSYAAPLSFPHPVLGALSVAAIGKSSITWRVGIFSLPSSSNIAGRGTFAGGGKSGEVSLSREGANELVEGSAACWGTVTHVFVDRETQKKSVAIGEEMRSAVEERMVVGDDEERGRSWVAVDARSRAEEGKARGKAKL